MTQVVSQCFMITVSDVTLGKFKVFFQQLKYLEFIKLTYYHSEANNYAFVYINTSLSGTIQQILKIAANLKIEIFFVSIPVAEFDMRIIELVNEYTTGVKNYQKPNFLLMGQFANPPSTFAQTSAIQSIDMAKTSLQSVLMKLAAFEGAGHHFTGDDMAQLSMAWIGLRNFLDQNVYQPVNTVEVSPNVFVQF